MLTANDLVTGADLKDLQELLGIALVDLLWLTGINSISFPSNKWKFKREAGQVPIPQPSLCILTRYLYKYDNENFLPELPDYHQIFQLIEPLYPYGKISSENTGPLWGRTRTSSVQWVHGHAEPSPSVNHLFLLLKRSIEKEGREGLMKYLKIVEEESQQRGIGSIYELLRTNTWHTNKFRKKYTEPINPSKGFITHADLHELRELLELNWWDTIWLTGKSSLASSMRTHGKEIMTPLVSPTLCIMIRYLKKYPEENFLPKMPEFSEIYELLKILSPFKKLSGRKIGPLFGVSGWSSNQWLKGRVPSPVIQRLFLLFKNAVEREGREGLDKYLDVLNEEIAARGLGNLNNVFREGWKSRE